MRAQAPFSARCKRVLHHWRTTGNAGRRAFPQATLDAIEAAIAAGERQHRAEIRLILEPALDTGSVMRDLSPRQRALDLFSEHAIWDTEENCGVLIYINLADQEVEIIADRNVNRRVSPQQWKDICNGMTEGYARGAFHESTLHAIDQLNALLIEHFPGGAHDDPNQLPDKPIVL